MKFTLSWLKDHLETEASLSEIVATLTRVGLEVEHVENPAEALRDFVIAHVTEAKPHPNADRLQVCMVDTGAGAPVQVVCGAPNARTGLKTVFSPPGTYIPGKKITLGKGVIRGVESLGMLCSGAELGLSEDHDGILELPRDAPIGQAYAPWIGLDDPMIEINLTPNRPDAMGVAGIARDLDAAGLGKVTTPAIVATPGTFPCPVSVTLDFAPEDAYLAPAFALRLVRGVRNGPSPEWLQKRLKAIGLRPINALVDITNYLSFDRARPLHVFDAKKVHGDLVVRRAKDGEEILALDGKTYRLDASTVVIADDKGVESIAGIMGGEASGCDEHTTDVLIESALWDPTNIARGGRKLGITSDARYRFERGIDPAFCVPGEELATQLVIEFCGGEASEILLAGKTPQPDRRVDFPWSEVKRLTGLDLPISDMAGILEKLGFELANADGNSDHVMVKVPSWRPDVEGKADLVEEIVRIAGIDNVVAQPLPRLDQKIAEPVLTLLQKRTRGAKRALASLGLVEAVTWSFVAKDKAVLFGAAPAIELANPIAAELSALRPSLLPGLVSAAQRNADRGSGDIALFEVGQIFKGPEQKDQFVAAAAIRRGTAKPQGSGRHWAAAAAEVDVFDAKSDALNLLGSLGVALGGLQIVSGAPDWFHPGRSGTLQFGPKNVIGWFGEFNPRLLAAMDVTGPLVGFEVLLDDIPAPKLKPTKAKPKLDLPEFMPLQRDFAFIVDRSVKAGDIVKAAQAGERNLVAHVNVFDIYEGKGVPEGKKSVAIGVTLQPRDKTLTEVEIEAAAGKIVSEVQKKTGASLRG
jgi:phenylalanyl-tRNA synthetase beta chain